MRMSNAALIVAMSLAGLAWLATVAMAVSLHESDAAGNGLTFSFGQIGVGVTWLLLSIVIWMWIGRVGAIAPNARLIAAAAALSGMAAFSAMNLMRDNPRFFLQWPVIFLVVPPATFLTIAWSSLRVQPAVATGDSPLATRALIVVLVLALVPFPMRSVQEKRLREQRAAFQRTQAEQQAADQKRWQAEADSQRLPPNGRD